MPLSRCVSKAERVDHGVRPLWQENFITMRTQAATDDDIMKRGRVVSLGCLPLVR